MAAYVQTLGKGTTGGTSATVTLTATMTNASNSIVVAIKSGTKAVINSVGDSKGNSYNVDFYNTSFTTASGIATCVAPSNGLVSGDTVTITFAASPNSDAIIAEYTSLGGKDQTGTGGSTSTQTSGSVTASGATAQASEAALVCFGAGGSTGTITATAPLVLRESATSVFLLDDDLVATGTPSEAWSWVTSRNWSAAMVTYPPASVAGNTFIESGVALIGRH